MLSHEGAHLVALEGGLSIENIFYMNMQRSVSLLCGQSVVKHIERFIMVIFLHVHTFL